MNVLRKLRPILLLCAMLIALAPLAADAKTRDKSPAHLQAEIDNSAARCGMLLAGVKVPGKLKISQCAPSGVGTTGGDVRALAALPSGAFLSEHQRAELANLAARCALVLEGNKISGKLRADQCAQFKTTAGGEVRALASLPAASCPLAPGASLSRTQMDLVSDFAHAKAKAEKKNLPEPSPSPEVAALLACS